MSKLQNEELIKDIFAFGLVLSRLGHEHLVESQTLFISALNEYGFTTVTGKAFTKQNFRLLITRQGPEIMKEIATEFEDSIIAVNAMCFQNSAITESIFA